MSTPTLIIRAGTGIGTPFSTIATPTFSPDGTKILFASNVGIYTIRLSDNNLVQITNQSTDTWPQWNPGGTKIVFSGLRGTGSNREICTINPDGTGLTVLTHDSAVPATNYSPSYTPEGAFIIYTHLVGAADHAEIWGMNNDGSSQTQGYVGLTGCFPDKVLVSPDYNNVVGIQVSSNSADQGTWTGTQSPLNPVLVRIEDLVATVAWWFPDNVSIILDNDNVLYSIQSSAVDGAGALIVFNTFNATSPSLISDGTLITFIGRATDAFHNYQLYTLAYPSSTLIDDVTIDCAVNQVTITGSGFGMAPGTIQVFNPLGNPINIDNIDSWTDTEIVITTDDLTGLYSFSVNGTPVFTKQLNCNYIIGSGLYELTKIQTHDDIYDVNFNPVATKIPDPFVVTAFLGDE